jgi:hypothetical protein
LEVKRKKWKKLMREGKTFASSDSYPKVSDADSCISGSVRMKINPHPIPKVAKLRYWDERKDLNQFQLQSNERGECVRKSDRKRP